MSLAGCVLEPEPAGSVMPRLAAMEVKDTGPPPTGAATVWSAGLDENVNWKQSEADTAMASTG
jgi:hypothetical protein